MYPFIDKAIDEQCDAKCSKIIFDFSKLNFIEPVGVVVLSNLIEYFRKIDVKVYFQGHTNRSQTNIFLDDSGFF
jgi:anti-anti-sigma regulatory factor